LSSREIIWWRRWRKAPRIPNRHPALSSITTLHQQRGAIPASGQAGAGPAHAHPLDRAVFVSIGQWRTEADCDRVATGINLRLKLVGAIDGSRAARQRIQLGGACRGDALLDGLR
jgi:hypothetical protein